MASEERFGFEWATYRHIEVNQEHQFKKWIAPLSAETFQGKSVLDAGCGMGRNSYWIMRWGGVSRLVAFDNNERTVAAARETLRPFAAARVEFCSIYDIAWKEEFDVVFSIGVIHHLKYPESALKKLFSAVRPGGCLLIWVYGYEGNQWVVRCVDPIRKHLTSRLPVGLVHVLAYACSLPLWVWIKMFRPAGEYFQLLSTFSFRHVHSIVFDQLIPSIANYWRREEVCRLFDAVEGIERLDLYPVNARSWTAIARKKSDGGASETGEPATRTAP